MPKALKTPKIKKLHSSSRRHHIKPRGHFPWISLILTIGAGIAWVFTIMYFLQMFAIAQAMNNFQYSGSDGEGWEAIFEELFGATFGVIGGESALAAALASLLLIFITCLAIAATLTILLIIGWTRKPHAW